MSGTFEPMLAIPLKKPDSIDWVKPLKAYVTTTLSKTDADALTEPLEHMNRLRKSVKDAADGKEKISEHLLENVVFPYCTLLQHASSHFPLTDGKVKLTFTWHDAGNARKKTTLPNIHLEIASVIFDAAMAYVSLAANEDRSTPEGVKTAFKHFQTAAGLLDFVRERLALLTDRLTADLSSDGLAMFSNFTLASAHHCSYLKADKEMKGKHAILSRLAMEGSLMYENLRRQMIHPSLEETVDKQWAKYAEFYRLVFEARAHAHLAEDLHAALEIGPEIARLNRVQELLTEAQGHARQLTGPYLQFLQQLQADIGRRLGIATNENEKIYHHRVPKDPLPAPAAFGKTLAKPTPFAGLLEASRERDPFTKITPVHILEAKTAFKDEVVNKVNQHCAETRNHRARVKDSLQQMGVVGAISAFDPSQAGLPAALHQRIAKIREGAAQAGGCCQQLMDSHAALTSLAKSVHDINGRLMEELLEEAKTDKLLREKFGKKWAREQSENVNKDLVAGLRDFRAKLDQAASGDRTIEERIKNYFDDISKLDLPPTRLDALLPDRSVAQGQLSGPMGTVVQELQRCLSAMDEKEAIEQVLLTELRDMLEQDERELGLQLAAAGPGGEVDVITSRRQKYEEKMQHSIQVMIDSDNLQATIAQTLKTLNEMRQMDGTANQREQLVNRLDMACNKFQELSANLKEGINFYATMSEATERQKTKVSDFVFARSVQKEDLMNTIQREAAQIENTQELLAAVQLLELESQKAKLLEMQQKDEAERRQRQQWQQWQQQQQQPQVQPQAQWQQPPFQQATPQYGMQVQSGQAWQTQAQPQAQQYYAQQTQQWPQPVVAQQAQPVGQPAYQQGVPAGQWAGFVAPYAHQQAQQQPQMPYQGYQQAQR